MKFLKSLVAFFAFAVIVASCNKNNNTPATQAPNPTPTPTPVSGYYGVFEHTNNFGNVVGLANLMFYDKPISPTKSVNGGSVSINGQTFNIDTVSFWPNTYYGLNDTLSTPNSSQWLCAGNGTVPAFSYTDSAPWPTYTGSSFLPDTIYTATANTIYIQGISGADEFQVNIVSGPNWYQKTFPASTSSIVVTASDLSNHLQNNTGFIQIIPKKITTVSFSGKPFIFKRGINNGYSIYFK